MNKKEHTNNDLINDHFPFPTEVHQFSLAVNDEFDTDTNVPTEMDQPAVGLAAAPPGVKVFGVERITYFREVASGNSQIAYFFGKAISSIYRIVLASL